MIWIGHIEAVCRTSWEDNLSEYRICLIDGIGARAIKVEGYLSEQTVKVELSVGRDDSTSHICDLVTNRELYPISSCSCAPTVEGREISTSGQG